MSYRKKSPGLQGSFLSQSLEEQERCKRRLMNNFNIDFDNIALPCDLYNSIYSRRFINSPYFLKLRRNQFLQELEEYVSQPILLADWYDEEKRILNTKKEEILKNVYEYIRINNLSVKDVLSTTDLDEIYKFYEDYFTLGLHDDDDAQYLIYTLARLYLHDSVRVLPS